MILNRITNVIFNKVKHTTNYRILLPKFWIEDIGINEHDKSLYLSYDTETKTITIIKA